MGKGKSLILLFGLEVLAISSYVWHQSVSALIGWNKSWRILHVLLLLALTALFTVGLWKLLTFIAVKTAQRYNASASAIFRALALSLSPLLFLFLIFLPYIVFLKDIRGYLLPVSIFASAYLLFIFSFRLKKAHPQNIAQSASPGFLNPNKYSSTTLLRWLFALSLLVNVILASGLIFPQQPFTGDEPHYLLVTKSILKDGDINIHNNYRDRDYLAFYPGELEAHAYVGRKGEQFLYSKHFPALSSLLVPAYFLGEKVSLAIAEGPNEAELKRRVLIFFSRLPLCVFTALFGILFFLVVFDVTQRKDISLLSWVFFCFTTPILFYSHLIYAEILVALLALFVIRNLILRQSTDVWSLLLSGAAIALLPWFGVKYLVLSALLFGASIAVRAGKGKIRQLRARALYFLSPIVVSAFSYVLFFWVLYGNLSPLSAYKGAVADKMTGAFNPEPPAQFISELLRRFLGYFMDQKFGLLIYSPVFLLGIAGFYFLLKKKRREALLLMTVLVVNTLISAAFYWGGYCPPPRPLIPVLGIWGLFMAIALSERLSQFRLILTTLCASLSFGVVWAGLRDPWLLYPDQYAHLMGGDLVYAKLFRGLSNAFIPIHTWLPSLTWKGTLSWLPIIVWVTAIALLTVLLIRKAGDRDPKPTSLNMIGQACLVCILCVLVLLYAFFDIHLDQEEVFAGEDTTLYFQDSNHFGSEVGGFWTKGGRPATIVLRSARPLSVIQVHLTSSVEGETMVRVGPYRKMVTRTEQTGLSREAAFTLPKGFPMQKGHLYTITIEDSTGFFPYRLDSSIMDNRYLGVFVQIKTRSLQ